MSVGERFRSISPAWRIAVATYLVGRLLFCGWSLVILLLFPTTVQNLDLFGNPVVVTFDLGTSERYVYGRQVGATTLYFRPGSRGYVVDSQTQSIWSLKDGRAVEGEYTNSIFAPSTYSVEAVLPYHGVAATANAILALWQRFDTNWYLAIAQQGYFANDGRTVFFPLYPLLIKTVGMVFMGNDLLAALIVSNAALVGALALFYRIATQLANEQVAQRSMVFLAIFPTSFFLFAGYTESLFLLLALASMYAGTRGRWGWAGILGALAALTRLQGVILIVPLAWLWWRQVTVNKSHLELKPVHLTLLLMPISSIAFLIWQYLFIDRSVLINAYVSQLHAQFVFPWDNLIAALRLTFAGGASVTDVLNIIATIIFATMTLVVWFKLPREYGLYTLLMFLAPLFRMTTTQPLVSMTRYVLVLFPVFVVLGMWGTRRWVSRVIIYLSFLLALYQSAQFILWGWVG